MGTEIWMKKSVWTLDGWSLREKERKKRSQMKKKKKKN
jgi:hypothetical protein